MDSAPSTRSISMLGGLRRPHTVHRFSMSSRTESSADIDSTFHTDTEDDAASITSDVSTLSKFTLRGSSSSSSPGRKHHISSFVSGRMSMTSMDTPQPRRTLRSHTDDIRESYRRGSERWFLTQKLNKNINDSDPLTYASSRLSSFLQFYDSILNETPMSAVAYHEQQTLSGFWSIQAFKYLTGVDGHIAFDVLADLSNNSDAKNKKRLKVLDMYNNSYTDSHIWQLAIDNPDRDIYCFTTDPILYTSFPDYKLAIGPQNFYILNGISYQNVPMTKNTFAAAICYDLHFYLKNDQWVPTLSEVFRLLTFNGQISIFLMDYSVLNCKNEIYSKFFEMLRNALRRDGMDPYPCKSIQKRLREAGFQNIRHAFVSLKKGIPTDLGNIVEFVQSFFECAMFKYVAQLHLSPEELVLFREMKLQYNRDVRNGELLDEFGDFYYMLVFAQKKTY